MNVEQYIKLVTYKAGEIVRYTGYEGDLINNPKQNPTPNKYFKVLKVDMDWGVVDYGKDTIGLSSIKKATFFEKLKWLLFW